MLPGEVNKIKQEEEDIAWGRYTAAWEAEHRERSRHETAEEAERRQGVRRRTAQMAAEAGFKPAAHSIDGRAPRRGPVATRSDDVDVAPLSVKTPRYDGKADWEAFHAQFEILSRANNWSNEAKALQLAMCLTGDALSSLLLLTPDDRSDYDALVGALKRRFGQCSAASLLRSELCSRKRRPGEPLRDLANEVEGLVHRAYAHMPPSILSELARDHFLQALLPSNLRIQTLLAHPKSLLEALELASEREMLGAGLPTTTLEDTPRVRAAGMSERGEAAPAWAEELTQLVRAASLRGQQRPWTGARLCWACGKPGHLARECPNTSEKPGNGMGNA